MNQNYLDIPIEDFEEIASKIPHLLLEVEGTDILILGGEGSLGGIIKKFLLYCNNHLFLIPCRIVSVDNFIGREKPSLIQDDWLLNIEHDLTIPLSTKVHGYNFSYILNMSGNAAPSSGYARFPIETMDVSHLGTKHLLELALWHEAKIVNMSSSEVVGNVSMSELPSSEEIIPRLHTTNKRSCYDLYKAAGIETQSYVYKEVYGVDVKVVRPFNVQFYYRQGDSRVVCSFMDKLLRGEKMPVYMPSTQSRTYCFYTDFIAGLFKVLIKGEQFLYNLGREEETVTVLQLAQRIEEVTGRMDRIKLVETPDVFKHEPQCRQPSIKRAKEELGYEANTDLDTMLLKTWNWCKNNYEF
jgi:nucleoside-diphosphate-sugar epimerase